MNRKGVLYIDTLSILLHLVPGIRRVMPPRVRTIRERNEPLQARSLLRQLETLEGARVGSAFIHTFVAPLCVHTADARPDLDADSFSLVKTLARGRHGTTYPDMTWAPKQSFGAVADYFAAH